MRRKAYGMKQRRTGLCEACAFSCEGQSVVTANSLISTGLLFHSLLVSGVVALSRVAWA